jgi:hypothetical protein
MLEKLKKSRKRKLELVKCEKKRQKRTFFKFDSRRSNESITESDGAKRKQKEKSKKEYNGVGIQSFFLTVIMIEL